MSKKISEMGAKLAMIDADEFTILDSEDATLSTKNKRVLKSVALAGMATQSSVDAVQGNLNTHISTGAGSAHPDGTTLTDLNNHKTGIDQHPISGVTGLSAALAAKANTADLGTSASRDVGTLAGDVAQGDAPAAAVSSHEGDFAHANLPTSAQKNALDANPALGGANPVPGRTELPSADQQQAMDAANSPSGTNAFATINDVGSGAVGSVTGQHSVVASPTTGAVVVNLVNDAASPGNSKYYGTSGAGARGFHDLPAGGGGVPEAPSDGSRYGRKDAGWEQDPIQTDAPSNGQDYVRKDGAWALAPSGGGWQDGTVVTDWGLTVQALGSVGGASSAVDLDNGHAITATMTADHTFNFTSTAGQTTTIWTATIVTAGFTPTWQFGGVAIDLPADYDLTGSPSRIEFTFIRTPVGVSVLERKIP